MSSKGDGLILRSGRTSRMVVLGVAVLVVGTRIALVPAAVRSGGSHPVPHLLDVLVPLAVALLMAHASWRQRRRSRRLAAAWGSMGLAWLAYATGEAMGSFSGVTMGASPGAWIGLGLYLAFYPLFLAGVLALPEPTRLRRERAPLFLDMAIVLLGMSLVLFTLLVRPALALGPQPPARLVMTVAAPAGDLVVLWVIVTLLMRYREGPPATIYGLFAASAATLIVVDVLYAWHLVWSNETLWHLLGPGWMAAHVLAGLAAAAQLAGGEGGPPVAAVEGRPSRASLYLAYTCLVVAIVVLSGDGQRGSRTLGTVIVVAIVGLVLARKMLGLKESDRLRDELVAARDTLEERVAERTAELAAANRSLAAEVEERRRAERRIEKELRRLAALRAIDQAITGSFDLDVTLGVFLENVLRELGVDAGAVLILDPVSQTLSTKSRRGFRSALRGEERLPIGEGHAGVAALERRPVSVSDLSADPDATVRRRVHAVEGFRASWNAPLVARGQVRGVLEVFTREDLAPDEDWLEFLATLAGQGAIAVDNVTLFERTQRSNVELARAYDSTLRGWALALELRDHETQGHSVRVTELTVRLARAFQMEDDELVHVRRGALLHDIGKIAIPDSILLKPGPLTGEEWQVMRRHPVHAFDLLSHVAYLRPALDIPYCHHEHWDGSGYPRGLAGAGIPLAARLFAVVDTWDALSFDRPYRPAWPMERVREHLEAQAEGSLDPAAVHAFLEVCA